MHARWDPDVAIFLSARFATENARAMRRNFFLGAFCDGRRARDALQNFSRRVLRPKTRMRRVAEFVRYVLQPKARVTRWKIFLGASCDRERMRDVLQNFCRRVLRRKTRARCAARLFSGPSQKSGGQYVENFGTFSKKKRNFFKFLAKGIFDFFESLRAISGRLLNFREERIRKFAHAGEK